MTAPTTTADQFLMGGGSASAKFESFGDSVTGTIASPPEVAQRTDPKDNSLKFWPDGNPQMQLVVTLQTTLRDDADDDGKRRIYVKGKSLTEAVREAVKQTGAKGLEIGGSLTITYIADGPQPSNKALSPAKLYSATYARPDTTASSGQFLGVQQPAAAPAAPTAAGPTPAQIAALKAAGVDPATVFPGLNQPPF